MLRLGCRGSRTVRNPQHVCASCCTSLPRAFATTPARPSRQHEGNLLSRRKRLRIQLWKDTLQTLKALQESVGPPLPPPDDVQAHGPAEGEDATRGDAEPKGDDVPATEAHGSVAAGRAGQQASTDRQQTLLEGALAVLKQVLDAEVQGMKFQGMKEERLAARLFQHRTSEEERLGAKKPAKEKKPEGKKKEKSVGGKEPPPLPVDEPIQPLVGESKGGEQALEKQAPEKQAPEKQAPEKQAPEKQAPGKQAPGKQAPEKQAPEKPKKEKGPPAPRARPKVAGVGMSIHKLDSGELQFEAVDKIQPPVPRVQYGLDRVLFNPGVYHIQDPRSRVYNFDPYLASIMPIQEFDFNALKQYVTSSKDSTLIKIAAEHKKKYTGSTSSMTAMLSHFHFLLSAWRPINPAHTSRSFVPESENFTRITRAPAAAFLHWKDGVYAIDADKQFDTANILSMLGKSMEKLLTLRKEDYEKYRVKNSDQLTEAERNADESYHYSTLGDFMMRSQLDAYDRRLPGSGMFDLKTRAVVSIRMDARDFHKGLGYEIRHRFGQFESFEREYFDMIRSAFLKYSLQVRMGRMDGIFVAFHNTQRIFGFQYISINEMDLALHGTDNRVLGDREFRLSLGLLNQVLDRASAKFPGRSLRIHIETRVSQAAPFMYIFATPVTAEEISAVQDANKASVEAFERKILGIEHDDIAEAQMDEAERAIAAEEEEEGEAERRQDDDPAEEDEDSLDVWEDMRAVVEQTMENETLGATTIREALEAALEQSGLLRGKTPDQARQYVDALLSVITSVEAERAERAENDAAKENADKSQDAQNAAGPSTPESQTSEPPSSEVSTKEPESDRSADLGGQEGSSTSSTPENLNLKNLIIKLAAQLEAAAMDGRDALDDAIDQSNQATSSDQAKLQEFGRILSEMIASSKESGRQDSGASNVTYGTVEDDPSKSNAALVSDIEEQLVSSQGTATVRAAAKGRAKPVDEPPPDEIYGMILTIRNKVNGKYVLRPEELTGKCSWVVDYAIEDMAEDRAHQIYSMVKKRRAQLMGSDAGTTSEQARRDAWNVGFRKKLHALSRRGREWRQKETKIAKQRPLHVLGGKPRRWEEVFGSDKE